MANDIKSKSTYISWLELVYFYYKHVFLF
jgi:hypothetical protein